MLSEGRSRVDNVFSLANGMQSSSTGQIGSFVAHSCVTLPVGILRLELDKESYERAGLVGKAIRDAARKHIKTRYGSNCYHHHQSVKDQLSSVLAVEINLRLPSMLHGKKGFERIVWAFKNVLNSTVTWLFHDCEVGRESSDEGTDRSCSGDACGVAVANLKV